MNHRDFVVLINLRDKGHSDSNKKRVYNITVCVYIKKYVLSTFSI